MHAETIVAQIIKPSLTWMHCKRADALLHATATLLRGGITSLSAIALHLGKPVVMKHRLKSVDRLLGNAKLHAARVQIYRCLAQRWLQKIRNCG